ncbi:MAG: XrtA/PEP-CTERM system TPR-repeat protein PrsT [Halioglobus sp.]
MNTSTLRGLALAFTLLASQPALSQDANQFYEKALQAYENEEVTEAYIHLKNALQQDPNMVAARVLLAEMYFNAGDILGAEKESEEALRLGADINLVLPLYGTSLIIQEKIDTLLALEKKASSFSRPTQFEWLLLKAQAYLIDGKSERARAELEKAAELFPADVRSTNSLAAIYLNSGLRDEARNLINKSLTLDPLNHKTWQLRGELVFSENKFEEARDHFSRAHDIEPDDLRVLRSLARVNLHLGDQAEMKRYLELILEISPDDPAATLLNAVLMIGDGDAELGEEMLGNLSLKLGALDEVQMHSSDGMLFIRAASDYVRRSDRSAITLFNAYIARNKSDLAAIRMLVDLYVRNNELRLATDLLRTNKEVVSKDLGLSLQLLHFYIQDKNSYAAKELLQELKTVGETTPYVPILEAEFLRSSDKADEALALLDEVYLDGQDVIDYDLLRGALQLQQKNYEAALTSAERLAIAYPEAVRAHNFGAVTYLRVGELDKAEVSIDRALALSPDNVDAHFNQSMLLKLRGMVDESNQMINRTLVLQPSHTKSILLMARNLFLQGQYDEAIEWTRKATVYDRTSARPAELQMEIYLKQNDLDSAVKVAAGLSRENPLNPDYLVTLSGIYMQMQEYELAQRPLHSLSLLWKEDPEKLRELAAMHVRTKNLESARKALEMALELDSESFPVRLDLAGLFLMEGEDETAESIAKSLQKKYGDSAELSFFMGEIAAVRKDNTKAQYYFMQAYKQDNNLTPSIFKLYELSAKGVGAKEFTDTMEKSLEEGSLPMWAVRLIADSYLLQGNSAQAQSYYEKLLAIPEIGNDPEILNNLANIYAETDLDKGLATAMRALEEQGETSSSLLDTIGWIMSRKGDNENALPYLRKAYALNSGDPQIRYHIGVALKALGRNGEAEKELRAALVLADDFPERAQVQSLVDELSALRSQ